MEDSDHRVKCDETIAFDFMTFVFAHGLCWLSLHGVQPPYGCSLLSVEYEFFIL